MVTTILAENNPSLVEEKLCMLYELVVEKHNQTAGMPHLDNKTRNYFGRPYKVIFAENIIGELKNSIGDAEIKNVDIRKYALDIIIDA
jgi:hypothetical protein